MRRWLPHPFMALALAGVWLLLANSASAANLVAGLLFGALITLFTRAFWPERPRLRRPGLLAHYIARLLFDIVRANINMVRLILGPASRLHPAFVHVPLDLRDEFAITILASTVSLTPGTVSADLAADGKMLLVHALDAPDPLALVRTIKQRYEAPLKEMFE